jgi:hypothetical protein
MLTSANRPTIYRKPGSGLDDGTRNRVPNLDIQFINARFGGQEMQLLTKANRR